MSLWSEFEQSPGDNVDRKLAADDAANRVASIKHDADRLVQKFSEKNPSVVMTARQWDELKFQIYQLALQSR